MHARLSMNNLKYPQAVLLEKLEANRKNHKAVYEEARVEYAKRLAADFRAKLADLDAGKEVNANCNLFKPVQFLADYDRAIAMLKMTTDKEIELDQESFAQLVLDEWSWQSSFLTNTAVYGNAK